MEHSPVYRQQTLSEMTLQQCGYGPTWAGATSFQYSSPGGAINGHHQFVPREDSTRQCRHLAAPVGATNGHYHGQPMYIYPEVGYNNHVTSAQASGFHWLPSWPVPSTMETYPLMCAQRNGQPSEQIQLPASVPHMVSSVLLPLQTSALDLSTRKGSLWGQPTSQPLIQSETQLTSAATLIYRHQESSVPQPAVTLNDWACSRSMPMTTTSSIPRTPPYPVTPTCQYQDSGYSSCDSSPDVTPRIVTQVSGYPSQTLLNGAVSSTSSSPVTATLPVTVAVIAPKRCTKRRKQCPLCPKSFSARASLTYHLRAIHNSGDRDLSMIQCQVCSKVYTHPSSLRAHLRSHTNERPFVCSICGKAFGDCAVLSRHRMTHSNLKPYKCELCEMTFTQLSNMKRHAKSQHGL